MIISRTPFRISFAGGGTDLRSFYSREPGQVISTAIDKFLYVMVRRQSGLVEYKYRVNYSVVEFRHTIDEIEHPIVREVLRMYDIDFPIEISTFADIPANTGLGSSSAFAVGLVHAICALQGIHITKGNLAATAGRVEVDILGRTMGKQDHYASAYGNINVFTFAANEEVTVEPVFYRPEVKVALENHLLLFFTGIRRDAAQVLRTQNEAPPATFETLRTMKAQVPLLRDILSTGRNLHEFGRVLHEGWLLKRTLSPEIAGTKIDSWYDKARAAGAIGGKLLGAGGGGFLLFFVEPQNQSAVRRALAELHEVKIGFDQPGSRITYYDQTPF
ncbi:MAG: GHMP kinase [Planctomycetaceae bacterium]|nr:GHMP kinase [Planctomycetaceae bacterium]